MTHVGMVHHDTLERVIRLCTPSRGHGDTHTHLPARCTGEPHTTAGPAMRAAPTARHHCPLSIPMAKPLASPGCRQENSQWEPGAGLDTQRAQHSTVTCSSHKKQQPKQLRLAKILTAMPHATMTTSYGCTTMKCAHKSTPTTGNTKHNRFLRTQRSDNQLPGTHIRGCREVKTAAPDANKAAIASQEL
jgi:hypothetical protein